MKIPEDRKERKEMVFQNCYATWYSLDVNFNNDHQAKERSSGSIIQEYRRPIQVLFLRCGSQSISKSQHPGKAGEGTDQASSASSGGDPTTGARSSYCGATTAGRQIADCGTSTRKRSAEERTRQAAG
jgi:hypothetical protein